MTKAIDKEMTNACIAFEKIDGVKTSEIRKGGIRHGYNHVNLLMLIDINMYGKFTRNKILVAYVHTTAPPSYIIYSIVVSRESIRIESLLASLNDLEIFAYDVGNLHLNTKCRENIWTEAGI